MKLNIFFIYFHIFNPIKYGDINYKLKARNRKNSCISMDLHIYDKDIILS